MPTNTSAHRKEMESLKNNELLDNKKFLSSKIRKKIIKKEYKTYHF